MSGTESETIKFKLWNQLQGPPKTLQLAQIAHYYLLALHVFLNRVTIVNCSTPFAALLGVTKPQRCQALLARPMAAAGAHAQVASLGSGVFFGGTKFDEASHGERMDN